MMDEEEAAGDASLSYRNETDCTLSMSDIRMTVKVKGKEREILCGVTTHVNSGEVLAILGPSGAGKTTLLDALTLSCKGGTNPTGTLKLNSKEMTKEIFTKYCYFVEQQDHHWAFLTCRETMVAAARLYDETEEEADKIIHEMGLVVCKDTFIGNQFLSGLSGGQKRRLSIGLALLAKPLCMFFDEPTSGLDAASAYSIIKSITGMAKRHNIIAVCTIHQPSSELYNTFDQVMVMSAGKVAFQGAADAAPDHFRAIGCPMPDNTNPADFLLNQVNADFSSQKQVDMVLDAWANTPTSTKMKPGSTAPLPERATYNTGVVSQTVTLIKRHLLLTIRDPTLYTGRMFMFLFACCFFAVIYVESRERKQEQIFNKIWMVVWLVGVPSCLGVIVVYAYNIESFSIRREIKNGMIHPAAYLISNLVIQLPLLLITSMFAISVSAYGISNFNGDNYFKFLFMYWVALWSFEAVAQTLSLVFANPLLGMLGFLQFWFCNFLFAGLLVPHKDIIWPFRVVCYIVPFTWGLGSLIHTEFADSEFDGAFLVNTTVDARGFQCDPGVDDLNCLGRTGTQVLKSLNGNAFDVADPKDHYGRNLLIILAIAVVFKTIYFVLFYMRTTYSKGPKSSSTK